MPQLRETPLAELGAYEIKTNGLRDIAEHGAIGQDGKLVIYPAEWWKQWTQEEIALFGHRYGLYSIPTIELVQWIGTQIKGRAAIEIGAGRGELAEALGIPATDSFQQRDDPKTVLAYAAIGQPTIEYGSHVEKLDAAKAVKTHKPKVVVAQWVTHKWDKAQPARKGNMHGVDEIALCNAVPTYIFIGNMAVHNQKPLWSHKAPAMLIKPDWLVSRSRTPQHNFIAVWGRP